MTKNLRLQKSIFKKMFVEGLGLSQFISFLSQQQQQQQQVIMRYNE